MNETVMSMNRRIKFSMKMINFVCPAKYVVLYVSGMFIGILGLVSLASIVSPWVGWWLVAGGS